MEIPSGFCTYILLCSDGSLYTGATKDFKRRICQHQSGRGAKYTRTRRPLRLVFIKAASTHREAFSFEAKIKRLTRKQKEKLIEHNNPTWRSDSTVT